ncbi:DUF6361 family protein [Paeniglutamicibacter antarcticus]|uniref:DUF6361 family protein n=1 Tax=Paeniglutamicibacter antarcticus TaxID=494023 RepID=A0ABP9TSR2_9MICC
MPSLISWLDANTAETNRMREIVKLFELPGSVDDLALGQFRDVISNSLFPGTSVLHVAAKYLILIPWCYQAGSLASTGEEQRAKGEHTERRLIRNLQRIGARQFIGSDIGDRISTLPSAAYWTALRRWGIVGDGVDRTNVGEEMLHEASAHESGIPTQRVWTATLPLVPDGFPASNDRGMELTRDEALWIQDRILATVPDTLLAHIVSKPRLVQKKSSSPWADPGCQEAQGEASVWLQHAQAYSALQWGLDSTYAHLLAVEASRKFAAEPASATNDDGYAPLDEWVEDDENRLLLRRWNLEDFLRRAHQTNPRIPPSSIAFLSSAVKELSSSVHPATNTTLHQMVKHREQQAKRSNSRFVNMRRLREWRAPESFGRQTFRWAQVRTMVNDIAEGLKNA